MDDNEVLCPLCGHMAGYHSGSLGCLDRNEYVWNGVTEKEDCGCDYSASDVLAHIKGFPKFPRR